MSLASTATHATRLAPMSAILVGGADARSFLQGQLSADIAALNERNVLLASCNSVQGRVQAVLWLVARSDGIALILPSAVCELMILRLRKYVLRSKVTLSAPQQLIVATIPADETPPQVMLPEPRSHQQHEGASFIRLPGHARLLMLTDASVADSIPAMATIWRLEDIRTGLPQIYPATHEAFVAQMLNLDLLGGIGFQKGCYTGQEIIARTHYRGAIKRRMLRFAVDCPPPEPGTRLLAGEQHAGDVVDAAPTGDGSELLAVVTLAQKDERLELESQRGVPLRMQTLPYELT